MVVLTGASGLLGSYILEALLAIFPPQEIIALYHSNLPAKIVNGVRYIQVDLLDMLHTEELVFDKQIDILIHAAALVSFDSGDRTLLLSYNKNITEHLVNLSLTHGVKKFIYISSIATLDRDNRVEGKLIDETHFLSNYKTKSAYAISKHLAEMEVWRGHGEGLNTIILNPGIILGYHQSTSSSAALFHKVKKGLKFYTNGVTSFVTARDVAQAVIVAIQSDKGIGERYVLSNGNYSYEFILKKIAASMDVPAPSIQARPWQSELLWRMMKISSIFTRKKPLITRETAHTAHSFYYFDNSKWLHHFPQFQYASIEQEIEEIGSQLK